MKQISVTVSGHPPRKYPIGTTVPQILKDIDNNLFSNAVALKINGELRDLFTVLEKDTETEIVSFHSREGHQILLHSAAHLMAQAVKELFPDAQMTIGPSIENRFYYDFDVETPFTEEDLENIENRMLEISKKDLQVERQVITRKEAAKIFKKLNESYKLEILEDIPDDETVSTYSQGDFIDLCRGPHTSSTGTIKYFKLLNTAGAYWRGDENNKMLQRIYGTAFFTKKDLRKYLQVIEKAKQNDHRKLGKELELFMFHKYSTGNPFFLPKGTVIYNQLVEFIRELYREYKYQEVISPQVFDVELWKESGHWELFREYMYQIKRNEREFGLKPMNCPGHTLIYSSTIHSYRELPLRLADFGRLHRYERAGVTSGLTRVRSFSQDDAHIFCTMDQIQTEMESLLKMFSDAYNVFGFDEMKIELSTRPEKALGNEKLWNEAESILKNILENSEFEFSLNDGEGAFYGPKIDFNIKDALQRYHQLGTIQLDFTLPERFKLTYIDEDGSEKRPIMIHRALLGSLERFFGVYLEHCGGNFPLWLAPVQIIVLPVSEKSHEYAMSVHDFLFNEGFRVEIDKRPEKVGAKIREAELNKINVMLIVGEKEAQNKTVSARKRFEGDLGQIPLDEFANQLMLEVNEKRRIETSQT